ncbi:hypothetical protein ACFLYL_05050 [Chloroflexota bacterium]
MTIILQPEKRLSALFLDEQTWGCLIVNDYNSSTGKETVSIIPG